jgi:hypothetical protein
MIHADPDPTTLPPGIYSAMARQQRPTRDEALREHHTTAHFAELQSKHYDILRFN